mgnify:CR=1 FL=1
MKNRVKYISFILFSVLSFGMFLGGAKAEVLFTESVTKEKGESWDKDIAAWIKCTSTNTNVVTATEGNAKYTFKAVGTGTAIIFCTNGNTKHGTIKVDVPKKGGASSINKEIQQGKSSMIGSYKTCTVKSGNVTLTNPNGKGYYINANADGTGKAIVSCMKEDDSIELYSISIVAAGTSTHPNGSNYNPDNNNTSSGTGGGTSMTANACLDSNSKGCAQIDATTNVVEAPTKYTEAGFCTDSVIKLNPKSEWASGSPVTGLSTTKTYTVTAHCTDDSSSTYTAYCIDPAVKGPTEAGWEYTADEQLDLDSDFGKAIYCLYKNSGGADYTTIQDTARLLMVKYGQPFLGIANGPYKKHALMYQSYGGSTALMGTVESCISSVQNNSMQMSFTQLTTSYENGNVTAKYKLILKNPKSGVDINSVNIVVKDVNGGSIGYTKTIENIDTSKQGQISADVILVIPAGSNCTLNVTASLKYYDADDVRNVFFARAKKNNMAQRFLVINNKGNAPLTLTETTSLNLSDNPSCVPNTPENLACVATNGFLCTPSETVATVYEGKSVGASADWDTCIVDKSDPNGNEYTIQEAGAHNYCKVVCKEDYAFKMPGDLGTVKQGRYISINLDNRYHAVAGVAAQRTCVTVNNSSSQGIAIEKYKTDALAKKKEMLDYLNLYNYYKGMLNRLTESDNGGLTQITSDVYLTADDDVNGPKKQTKSWTKSSGCVPNNDYSWENEEIDYYNDFDFAFKFNKYKFNTNNSDTLSILKAEIVIDKENIEGKSDNSINAPSGVSSKGTIAHNRLDETRYTPNGTKKTLRSKDDRDRPASCDRNTFDDGCYKSESCTTATYSVTFGKEEDAKGNYKDAVYRITEAKEDAGKKYENARRELQSMTEEIGMCTNWKTDYQFDPEITFTYDESSYMEMMNGNNKLKMDGDAKVNSTTYYCSSNVGYNSFESCSPTPSSDNSTYTFLGGKLNDDGTLNTGDSMAYYNYKMIGSIDKYGDVAGQQFIYFKSMVPFYTYPSKGFVTANEKQPNSQLVDIDDSNRGSNDADGLIYPISLTTPEGNYTYTLKFANIGQYFNSSKNLGRIMGINGYLSGTAQDQFVCTYKVEPIIPSTDDENKCATIAASDKCKSNPMSDECFYELLNSNCCDYLDLNKDVTVSRIDDYNAACPRSNTCSGYRTINYTTTIGNYDSVKVTDNGKLQFYVKSVSLNNLFPNGDSSKGLNWMGSTSGAENNGQSQDISEVIKDIEDKGEQIYGNDDSLIYSIKLTPACMAHVREYNKEQETNSLGFADYTLTTNYGDKSKGANDSSTFLSQLENSGCVVYKNKLN